MANIRPNQLPAAGSVNPDSAIIVDNGVTVEKATPAQVVASGRPLADQTEAEAGSENSKAMTALRVAQAIGVQAVTPADLASIGGSGGIGYTQSGDSATGSTVEAELRRSVWAENYGFSPSGTPEDNAAAFLKAVKSLRTNPASLSTDGLNGGPFTAYSSGLLNVGPGVFPISPDVLEITQDLGLIIRGQGSRRTNLSVLGRTVLLVTGVSNGFGIQVRGNGARGLTLEDIDLVYASADFTGDLLDVFGAPGVNLVRTYIGTNGITGGTRLTTARSCLRSTYDEFIHCLDSVFSGAIDGWWSDDTREPPTGPTNEFGGSGATFSASVFYDFTGNMLRHDGNRNRKKVNVQDCTLNPIITDCERAIDFNNVDAFRVGGNLFTPSVANVATEGWLRFVNCTGKVEANEFLGDCAAGSLSGNIAASNNFIGTTDGFVLAGGCVTASGNEFANCDIGWSIEPSIDVTFRFGPDTFRSSVNWSYSIASDSAFLDGFVVYSATQDSSINRFRNSSARVAIRANDEKRITIADASYAVLKTDTGRKIELTASPATATLPSVSNVGLQFSFMTNGSNAITISAPSGTLYVGDGGAKTSMTSGGDAGVYVTVENFAGVWNVVKQIGSFNYTA